MSASQNQEPFDSATYDPALRRTLFSRINWLAWYVEASKADWKTPQTIKDQYASASFVGRNRVVFNIKGNDFRLIVAMAYQIGVVYVKFVGTHANTIRSMLQS